MNSNYNVLCITDKSDLPETELFIGLSRAGVKIEVMCNPKGKHHNKLSKAGITTYELFLKGRYSKEGRQVIKDHFKKHHYDIVYCFNNHALTNLLMATPKGKFTIISYRGIVGNLSPFAPGSWMCHLNPRVKRIACVCNAVKDYILGLKAPGIKIPSNKALTIYKGHDVSWYDNAPADLTEFNLPEDAFIISFAGRNRPRKGLKYLVESATHLPKNLPIYFLLLGNLKKNKNLIKQIEKSPYRKNFILTGYRNDAPAVFRASDTFILPSTKREGLARAVIEAMASETIPIVSDVGGMPEIVKDGKSGFVVKRKNSHQIAKAIMKLFNNPERKEKMAKAARKRICKHFHASTTVSQTIDMFEDVMR